MKGTIINEIDMGKNNSVLLFDVSIQTLPLADFLMRLRKTMQEKGRLLAGNVNIHAMNLAWENQSFREALKKFDMVICDGFGVKLGAALTGQHIPERYTPPDFIHRLMQIVCEQNGSIFLLGAAHGVAERAAAVLQQSTPGLKIAGVHHGFFDKSKNSFENKVLLEQINTSQPSLLLVAFGMPHQELWLAENWPDLKVNTALTVGALFDTLAGDILRAPRWVTDHGFEWLARLLIEPRRLWRRYIIGNPLFFWRVICHHWFGLRLS